MTQLDAYRRDEERESRLASADAEDLFAEMQPAQPEEVHEEPVYLQLVEPVKVEAKTAQDEDVAAHEENSIVNLHEAITEHASPTLALPTMTSSSSSVWSVSITVPPSFSKSPATAESGGVRTSPTSSIHVDDLQSDDIHDKLVYPTAAQHESAPKSTTLTGPSSLNSQQSAPLQTAISPVTQSTSTAASSPHVSVTIETLEPELARADKTDSAARTTGSNGDRRHTSASSHAPQSPPKASSSGPSLIYRTVNSGQQQATASPARRNESKPQVIYTHGHHSTHQPNESIYGTIMKRLLALEVNSTLSTTYLEEQSRMVWDTFRRIEDRLLTMEKTVS